MSPSKTRKTASHGYAAQILACVIQHNENVTVLSQYQARLQLCTYGDPGKDVTLRHWTPLVIVNDQYSQLVYPNICIK